MSNQLFGLITEATAARLKDYPNIAIVHSKYARTINLEFSRGLPNLLTLADSALGLAPNTLILNQFQKLEEELNVGDHVSLEKGQLLKTKNFQIRLTAQTLIENKVIPSFLALADRVQRLEIIATVLREHNPYSELPLAQVLLATLEKNYLLMEQGLRANNGQQIKRAVSQLIGLGLGLTPSGDDFLTGLGIILNLTNFTQPDLRKKVNQALLNHLSQTNIISQHQLYFATTNEIKFELGQFLNCLSQAKNPSELITATKNVLAIGSTSGYDLLRGIQVGLNQL